MGYLEQKFSTLFKGPYALYWKEKTAGKTAIRLVIHLRRFVFESIPAKVRKDHDIEGALKDQDKLEEDAREAGDGIFRLGFSVELDEEKALEIIQAVEKAFIEARKKHGMDAEVSRIEAEFQARLLKALEESERETKEVYWRQLEPVIKVAEQKGDHAALMAKVSQLFKTKEDVSRFASLAFRLEAKAVKRSVADLGKDKGQIESLLKILRRKSAKTRDIKAKLKEATLKLVPHARKEFKAAYLMWKRDFLLNLVLLNLLDMEEAEEQRFAKEHLMPLSTQLKNIQDIEAIKAVIVKNAHVLAQGFRRLIGEERSLESVVAKEAGQANRGTRRLKLEEKAGSRRAA
jgi:hypothetical protein